MIWISIAARIVTNRFMDYLGTLVIVRANAKKRMNLINGMNHRKRWKPLKKKVNQTKEHNDEY